MKLLNFEVGNDRPLFLIAGPCVIETQEMTLRTAQALKEIATRLCIPFIFKSGFDQAYRKSGKAYGAQGMELGLHILELVQREIGVPLMTDVHKDTPVDEVARVVDVLQTPAFLLRETSFLQRVARAGKPVHVKRDQFMSPWELPDVIAKFHEAGNDHVMLCERCACFGYDTILSNMRALEVMKQTGCPVVFDATHSGFGPNHAQRSLVPTLARAATAVGVAGVFLETHLDSDRALSAGPTMWPLDQMEELLALDHVVKPRRASERGHRGELDGISIRGTEA